MCVHRYEIWEQPTINNPEARLKQLPPTGHPPMHQLRCLVNPGSMSWTAGEALGRWTSGEDQGWKTPGARSWHPKLYDSSVGKPIFGDTGQYQPPNTDSCECLTREDSVVICLDVKACHFYSCPHPINRTWLHIHYFAGFGLDVSLFSEHARESDNSMKTNCGHEHTINCCLLICWL